MFFETIRTQAIHALRDVLNDRFPAQTSVETPSPTTSRPTLADLNLDDLRREKIRIEQEERKMLARIRELETMKRRLFEQGTRLSSEREQRALARQIRDLDVQAHNMDRMLQAFSKQMRVITGLLQIKERQIHTGASEFSEMLNQLDLQEVLLYVDRSSVEGEFHLSKFDQVLGAMEEADALRPHLREDEDVLQILEAMQQAHDGQDAPAVLEERFNSLTQKMQTAQAV